tara:strand:+ start:7922 stop:8494 length:573 start_codon:yes stop_codon:yes gene_type:complete
MDECTIGLYPSEVGNPRLRNRILSYLPVWEGYTYGHKVDYPPDIPGVPSTLIRSGTREIDCSSFTYGLLAQVYPKAGWSFTRYKQWQMWSREDLWGPLTTATDMGITTKGTGNGWYLYQKWDERWKRGHSFLALKRGQNLLVLEANLRRNEDGVVWRDIGPAVNILPSIWSGTEAYILGDSEYFSVRLRG